MKTTRTLLAAVLLGSIVLPASAQDQITLDFYHTQLDFLPAIVQKFNETHPTIQINDLAPAESYLPGDQNVIRGLMTGTAPDIYLPSYSSIATLVGLFQERDQDVPFTPFLEAEGADWVSANYSDAILDLAQVDGVQYAMPFNASLPVMYVNQELIEQAGGSVDDFPTTWEGVTDLATRISALGDQYEGISFSVGGFASDWLWQMMVLSTGASMLNDDMTGIGYDNEQGLEALRVTQDFAVKSGMSVYASATPSTQQFYAGTVGIIVGSSASTVSHGQAVGDRFTMRTVRFPLIDAEKGSLPAGGNALMILTQDEAKQAAAWEFVKYMTSPEVQAEVAKLSGYMPTNQQSADVLAGFYAENPNFQTVFNSMDAAGKWFAYPNNTAPDLLKELSPILDGLQRGNITPEDALVQIRDSQAAVLANQ